MLRLSIQIGVQFVGNTVYTSVWVAAVCLFMELLGFSTQKWITAGGFGTVLLTLAGREVKRFASSRRRRSRLAYFVCRAFLAYANNYSRIGFSAF